MTTHGIDGEDGKIGMEIMQTGMETTEIIGPVILHGEADTKVEIIEGGEIKLKTKIGGINCEKTTEEMEWFQCMLSLLEKLKMKMTKNGGKDTGIKIDGDSGK